MKYKAIVIGSSAGGLNALRTILTMLGSDFKIPIIIVQHTSPSSDNYITTYLDELCGLRVKEADEKEIIVNGHVYFAPPNFHLLVEENGTFSLSIDERINFARPSIDVLFDTATYTFQDQLIGIILTGANHDGAKGLKKIKQAGGLCIVQDPKTAEVDSMPLSAIQATKVDHILPLAEIAKLLISLDKNNH
jgi:two-component system, chemotaxis family, protein-glutamate methylesterase/glutaminase